MTTKDKQAPEKTAEKPAETERQQDINPVTPKSEAKPQIDNDELQREAMKVERQRTADILEAAKGKHVDALAQRFITEGRSAQDFKDLIAMSNTSEAPPSGTGRIDMTLPMRRRRLRVFKEAGEEAAYRAGMWARAAVFGDQDAARWCRDYGVRIMTGATSGQSSVVPDEMVLPIIDLREEYGIARRYCRIHPMSSDTATVPRRKSGVTAYFLANRTTAITESDMDFDDVNLVARELAALTRLSQSYASDAVIDLAETLATEMAYAFAVTEDDCLFNGDGSSTYGGIYGIRPKIIDGNHTAGAIDATTGTNTFAEVVNDDLVSLTGVLPLFPGINPRWFISKRGNALVFDALKAAAGGNTIDNLANKPKLAYLGDEIVITQSMPTSTGDLENVAMIVYGDLDMGATLGDRQGIEVQVLRERYAEYNQIGVKAVERVDIVAHGLGDTSNAGPIVALIGA